MADVHVDCRDANVGSMPPMVHSRETTHRWMRGRLEGDSTGWVAERDGRVVGYLVLTGDWVDDLFLAPGETGQGIGAALLDLAKAQRPGGPVPLGLRDQPRRPPVLPTARVHRARGHGRVGQRRSAHPTYGWRGPGRTR